VKNLQQLLEVEFRFKVFVVELKADQEVQAQLEVEVMSFTQREAKPDKLVILYYAGHGLYDERKKVLLLHASVRSLQSSWRK